MDSIIPIPEGVDISAMNGFGEPRPDSFTVKRMKHDESYTLEYNDQSIQGITRSAVVNLIASLQNMTSEKMDAIIEKENAL